MLMLELFELLVGLIYLVFLITEVFIPLAKSTPLFPSFRKTKTKTNKGDTK